MAGMKTHRSGHDGVFFQVHPDLMRPPSSGPRWLRSYLFAMSYVFLGIAIYSAWLQAGRSLAASVVSAVVCVVWARATRRGL